MRRSKPDTSPVSLNDEELFCDFAERSGQSALAEAVRLVYKSRATRKWLQTQPRFEADSPSNSAWTEVDYKEYPRFDTIKLSNRDDGDENLSLSKARGARKSCRKFSRRAIALRVVEKALRFAQADRSGFDYPSRAFPSAGGLYCTETYLVAGRVEGLLPGVYHYAARDHILHVLPHKSDTWKRTCSALVQHIGTPAAFVVESVRLGPLLSKYGARGIRFGLLEVGAAAEALDLTATSLGLATLWLGGFADEEVWELLGVSPLHEIEIPLVIIALGYELIFRRDRSHKSSSRR